MRGNVASYMRGARRVVPLSSIAVPDPSPCRIHRRAGSIAVPGSSPCRIHRRAGCTVRVYTWACREWRRRGWRCASGALAGRGVGGSGYRRIGVWARWSREARLATPVHAADTAHAAPTAHAAQTARPRRPEQRFARTNICVLPDGGTTRRAPLIHRVLPLPRNAPTSNAQRPTSNPQPKPLNPQPSTRPPYSLREMRGRMSAFQEEKSSLRIFSRAVRISQA